MLHHISNLLAYFTHFWRFQPGEYNWKNEYSKYFEYLCLNIHKYIHNNHGYINWLIFVNIVNIFRIIFLYLFRDLYRFTWTYMYIFAYFLYLNFYFFSLRLFSLFTNVKIQLVDVNKPALMGFHWNLHLIFTAGVKIYTSFWIKCLNLKIVLWIKKNTYFQHRFKVQ